LSNIFWPNKDVWTNEGVRESWFSVLYGYTGVVLIAGKGILSSSLIPSSNINQSFTHPLILTLSLFTMKGHSSCKECGGTVDDI